MIHRTFPRHGYVSEGRNSIVLIARQTVAQENGERTYRSPRTYAGAAATGHCIPNGHENNGYRAEDCAPNSRCSTILILAPPKSPNGRTGPGRRSIWAALESPTTAWTRC